MGQSKYGLRISAGYSGYTGSHGVLGLERSITPSLNLLAQFSTNNWNTNVSVGFRYKVLNYKDKASLSIGADVGRSLYRSIFSGERYNNPYFFAPVAELQLKVSKSWSVFGAYSLQKKPSLSFGAKYSF